MTDSATNLHVSTADPLDVHIGAKLRELRMWRRVTRESLGEALKVRHQQVAKYETGENRIAAATLYRAAKALGIKPEWFFEGLDETAAGGEAPPVLDAAARKLLEAFDRIESDARRKLVASFVDGLAPVAHSTEGRRQ
jgi:transcriptional regulator with XRE-family HTH domain